MHKQNISNYRQTEERKEGEKEKDEEENQFSIGENTTASNRELRGENVTICLIQQWKLVRD